MATDWMKLRTDLYRDPKVCQMADLLMDPDGDLAGYVNQNLQCGMCVTRNVMRNATVGALASVWGTCRTRGKRVGDDLVIENVNAFIVDDISEMPGLSKIMIYVGWLVEEEKRIIFPRFFEEWNTDPKEDYKQKNAERQRRFREKQGVTSNVTRNVKSNGREEKSREDINTPLTPLKGGGRKRRPSRNDRLAEQVHKLSQIGGTNEPK